MTSETDKDLVWHKLSTVPTKPIWCQDLSNLQSISMRQQLETYLKLSASEVDELLDGYESGR